ncbi:aminotransferase class III-fold pyridoxal phosphate-dependent enzyme [Streptomyces sp. KA12]|uniref:aspartate aminotransferase family protein n=1 Tax=Streptomyces sp. KA12 TaxID=2991730 RepID=UPI0023B07470|nr:aminotransferase class III-fold pyridoxal phosphate-dependent enzyme [Streptomyces sp. KA12]MDF0374392.1 aminotransferase class III-fold pyridoxal phosphate-dependent enzyme [Streptomyces sp. KA12]
MTTYAPYPLYFSRGEGARVKDLDGRWYHDMVANYGALTHGHNHPALTRAVRDQIQRGTALGGPSTLQYRHADLLCARVPALERLRYCNSGTEATMWALRTARAYTSRDVIVKIDGGYHGTHDWGHVSAFIHGGKTCQQVLPDLPTANLAPGVPESVLQSIVTVPFNDAESVAEVLTRLRGSVAGLIVEPVLGVGGGIPARPEYLAELRQLTSQEGVVLIFDECATFRLGPWQVKHGIEPDLSTFSKILGGGLPIGVFGGSAEIMSMFSPSQPEPLYHASAFGGNSLSLAAGIAALETFGDAEIALLDSLGSKLRAGLDAAARKAGVVGRAVGEGGLSYFHFGSKSPRNASDTAAARRGRDQLRALVHLHLLNEGFLTARHGLMCQHIVTDLSVVEEFVEVFASTLQLLHPYIAQNHPDLLLNPGARNPPTAAGRRAR